MKCFFVLFFLLQVVSAHAIDVYIVAGQSNGWNLSKLRANPKKRDNLSHKVYYYGMNCVSEPDQSTFKVFDNLDENYGGFGLAKTCLDKSGKDIVFIQFCRCGSPIHEANQRMTWYPGEDPKNGKTFNEGLYDLFLVYLEHAKEELKNKYQLEWNLKGLFWHQGESESESNSEDSIKSYPKNLRNLIYRFRSDLGDDLNIVSAHIRELDHLDPQVNQVLNDYSKEDSKFTVVESNDLSFRPDKNGRKDVHFNEEGAIELGKRMGRALK